MFVKRSIIVLTALIVMLFPAAVCYVQSNTVLSQACAWEQNIDVFVVGDMNVSGLGCRVSNQTAEVVDGGLLADKGVAVRTTILIDISTSMPSQVRGNIVSFIDLLIKNLGKNEQYKIVAFGEQLSVLQDFTSDRYDLAAATDKIEFNGQQSKIYDAVYNTIPRVQPIDAMPCYYRTVIITDGVDDTASGVTKEELYLKLQADTYPIDVVAVSKTKQAEPEKELSALTRMSRGKYTNLYAGTDLQELSSSLAAGSVFWLRATIPGTLLDGSTRQIDISDGVNSLQFDFKVPVFEVPVAEISAPDIVPVEAPVAVTSPAPDAEPAKEPAEETAPSPSENITQPPLSSSNSKSGEHAELESSLPSAGILGKYTTVVYVGGGVVVIILTAVIIAVVVVNGKKKKDHSGGVTSKGNSAVFSQKTEILVGGPPKTASKAAVMGGLCVRLRNINNPDQVWEISLSSGVLIGRDTECQVCIDEKSMSRRQCRFYVDAGGNPTAENLSSANVTQLNGEPLNTPRSISESDKLKCGHVTLMIDSLCGSSSGNSGNINRMTEFLNV